MVLLYYDVGVLIHIGFAPKILKGGAVVAYKITDLCVNCGTCEPECPVGAISAGSGKFVVDPDSCIECNACALACPTDGAIES